MKTKPLTRKILWTLLLVFLLALCTMGWRQSRSWERQAKAYAELAGRLEAILSVEQAPGTGKASREPTFPGSQLPVNTDAREAAQARQYQVSMYQAQLQYLRRRAQAFEDHVSAVEKAAQAFASDLPEPPFTFQVKTVTLDGEPVPGVSIRCLHPRPERGAVLVDRSARSNQEGITTFTLAQADLMQDRYCWFSLADPNFAGEGDIGVSPLDGQFSLTRRVLPTKRFALRVEDEGGKGIPAATLQLMADHDDFPQLDKTVFTGQVSAQTDQDGRAALAWPDIPSNIAVTAKTHASTFIRNAALSGEKTLVVVLARGKTLRGKATDEKGRPLPDIAIEAQQKMFGYWPERSTRNTRTDADGRFELKGLCPGQWKVRATQDNGKIPYDFETRELTVPRQRRPKEITLAGRPGFRLLGTCVSKQSIALRGQGTRLPILLGIQGRQTEHRTLETKEDGSFVITGPSASKGSFNFSSVAGFDSFIKTTKTNFPFFKVTGDILRFDAVPAGTYEGVEIHYARKLEARE